MELSRPATHQRKDAGSIVSSMPTWVALFRALLFSSVPETRRSWHPAAPRVRVPREWRAKHKRCVLAEDVLDELDCCDVFDAAKDVTACRQWREVRDVLTNDVSRSGDDRGLPDRSVPVISQFRPGYCRHHAM